MYPADSRHKQGKLRLMYECNPMAFIVEAAGGKASNGKMRILDISPQSLNEHTPFFIGCKEDINNVEEFMKKEEVSSEIYIGNKP